MGLLCVLMPRQYADSFKVARSSTPSSKKTYLAHLNIIYKKSRERVEVKIIYLALAFCHSNFVDMYG